MVDLPREGAALEKGLPRGSPPVMVLALSHPSPFTLHPKPYPLHPAPSIHTPYTLHPTLYTIHHIHPTFCTLITEPSELEFWDAGCG